MRTAAITLTLVLTTVWAQAKELPQAEYHVATTGADANDGSPEQPFATLARAQQAVRSLIAAGLDRSVTVLVHGGQYLLDEPLRFGPEDSGTEQYSITYAACPDQQVVLSGGRVLSGWKNAEGNRWTMLLPEVKAGRWWFRQLFAGGKRLPRARFPNRGSLLTVRSVSADVKTIRFDKPLTQADLAGGTAELVMYQNWSISRALVRSATADAVTTATPVGWIGHGPATTASPGKPAYLEHAAAFLDQPREWFLDCKTGLLWYQAAPGEDPKARHFIAPALPLLVQVAGRAAAPVRRLVFRGLTFAHAAWPLPPFGYSGIQAGHYGPKLTERTYVLPPALEFTYAEQCRLERCRVAHIGATGIGLGAGCRHCVISGCTLWDIGGNGVMVGWRGGVADSPLDGKPGDPSLAADWHQPEQVPVGNEVSNNTVRRCGAVNHGCVGIYAAFCSETTIAHNLVADMPYTGVSIGFRWDESPTSQRGCLVQYNHIHDVMLMLADGGGIYTLGRQPGTALRGNLIHDVHRSRFAQGGAPNNGIFFDQGSKGYLVEANTIYKTSGAPIRFNQTKKENFQWRENRFGTEAAAANPAAAASPPGPLPAYRDK